MPGFLARENGAVTATSRANDKPSELVTPAIITALTNHAIGQLLDRCSTLVICTISRLGSGGRCEGLAEHNAPGLPQRPNTGGRLNGNPETAILARHCLGITGR